MSHPGPRAAVPVTVGPDVAALVRPGVLTLDGVTVVERDARLDGPLAEAAATARRSVESADVTSAVRTLYKRVGIDPTKTRPSSEALLRRVRKGGDLPRVNNAVDVVNWCSLESQLPFGLYDRDRLRAPVTLRLGRSGEEYAGIRKDAVHVEGRLTLADADGPFGNPTSDSARTMVTPDTTCLFVVIFAPLDVPEAIVRRTLDVTRERLMHYCGAGGS